MKNSQVLIPLVYLGKNPLYYMMVRPSTSQIVIMIALDFVTTNRRLTTVYCLDIPDNFKNSGLL
jgi:hypothetical protein